MHLFLDDERYPHEVNWVPFFSAETDWKIVRNYFEFVDFIVNNGKNLLTVSFDHDLGPQTYKVAFAENLKSFDYSKNYEFNGLDCAKFLINYCHDYNLKFPSYYIHSMNPIGIENIRSLIQTAFKAGFIS